MIGRGRRSTFDIPQILGSATTDRSTTIPIHLCLDDELSGFTVMDSELRKTLLKEPSTSASTALVRSLDSKTRNAECSINANFLPYLTLPYPHGL